MNPYQPTRDFEAALAEYTGARYAVALNSCTAALMLAVNYYCRFDAGRMIEIPTRTYVSVPMAIINAGAHPVLKHYQWNGCYQLKPLPVWDCARRFTSGMYVPGQFQ